MKIHYIILGLFYLLAIVACSDNDPVVEVNNGNQTEELPPLPTEVITGSRAMWVSYDPISASDPNNASGIASALISWRLLKTDPSNVAFDIYKSVDGETEVKLNEEPISNTTSWVDADIDVSKTNVYRVTLANQAETLCDYTFTSEMAEKFYHEIRLNMNVPDASITYSPDDIQLGDLDGDGELEIVVKREPYDGANMGVWFNGTTLLEAYKMDGTFLWRIDLGINIRSGSHYTSYVLYDFDGDGLCEIAFRSSEGTKFADGKIITDANGKVNDYRNRQTDGKGWYSGAAIARDQNDPSTATTCGLIMEGPEYISICRGYDGREITRIDNIPRGGEGSKVSRAKYWSEYWGDDFGNRMDRFFIGVAYLDGIPDETTGARVANPSLIISRGIYKNWQVWALDLKGNELVPRWKFDTADHSSKWLAMCSHCFRVADLDGDGRDEILYGSAAIDDDGSELWCSGNGHGDILHVGKFIKDRSGLQIVASFEESKDYEGQGNGYACQVIDARDGSMITGHGRNLPVDASDVGRCIVADVDPDSPDFEYWSSTQEGMFSCNGTGLVSTTYPTGIANGVMYNVAIYWSGQSTREMYDRTCIVSYKDNPDVNKTNKKRLLSFKDAYGTNDGNHGTKYNPCYYGDFLGDYREEVILGSSDNKSIYIFSTNHPTTHRLPHLMTDHNYDMSQAMQNMGYNQGTNLGYYVGAETLKTSETEEPKE
jgi:rhamnogalacturonan endolyase